MRYDATDRESTNVEDHRGGSSGFSLLVDKIAEYINPRHAAPKASNGVNHGRVGDGTPEEREPLKEWKTQGDELLRRAEERRLEGDPLAPGSRSMDIGQSWLDTEIERAQQEILRKLEKMVNNPFPNMEQKGEDDDPEHVPANREEIPSGTEISSGNQPGLPDHKVEIPPLPGYDNTAE